MNIDTELTNHTSERMQAMAEKPKHNNGWDRLKAKNAELQGQLDAALINLAGALSERDNYCALYRAGREQASKLFDRMAEAQQEAGREAAELKKRLADAKRSLADWKYISLVLFICAVIISVNALLR